MITDTPGTESNASLSVRDAAALFSGEAEQQHPPEAIDPPESEKAGQVEEQKAEEQQPADETITIEVDGKSVEVKKSELPDLYKNGLRQADYTRKTMEVAEQRKVAEAEAQQARAEARAERDRYVHGLQRANAVLVAQLSERSQEQWAELAQADPARWVQERNLYEQRHAAFQQNQAALGEIDRRSKAEAEKAQNTYFAQQQEQLLAKLPEWRDASKYQAEQTQICKYLQDQGFEPDLIVGIQDHRMVMVARDAMRYREMIAKAQATAKQVKGLPTKVERPGGGETNPLDGRTSAMQKLSKSGSVKDAAAVFEKMFK